MVVKNRLDIFNLARDDDELQILEIMLDSIDYVIESAQPHNFMSSSVSVTKETMEVGGEKFDFSSYDNFYLLSFGKASQPMTEWVLDNLPVSFSRIILVSPEDCGDNFSSQLALSFFKGGHPLPNEKSVEAAANVLSLFETLTEKDLCIILISGGGSSLLELPDFGVSLSKYNELTQQLLHSGASIHEINTLRKHFSKIKGGKLATKAKATLVSLIISDVVSNDPSSIASGPTVPDETTWDDCLKIINKYGLSTTLPIEFSFIFKKDFKEEYLDTPSDSSLFTNVFNFVIGDNCRILDALKEKLTNDFCASIVDCNVSGDAKEKGNELANLALKNLLNKKRKCKSSLCFLLFGGETIVRIQSASGIGGRNQELALSFALYNKMDYPMFLVAIGTDGIDGNSRAAGALVGPFTISDSAKRNSAINALDTHNSNSFFKENGGEIITGYTGTNIMDVGIICLKTKS